MPDAMRQATIAQRLREPLDPERRAGMAVLVAMRWLLAATAVFAVNYRPTGSLVALGVINLLIAVAVAINLTVQWRLRAGRPLALGWALVASVFDATAITVAVDLVDGFRSNGFVLYYPALLAFSVVFPGRPSLAYGAAVALAYLAVALAKPESFDPGAASDQRALALRLATMAATVLIANIVVRIERERRERAVAAEAERAAQVLALEQRARELEQAAQEERRRLSREVHDGVSQAVYMLTLGLETAAALAAREDAPGPLRERLAALVALAKQALLDTRNLLFDLEGVLAGQTALSTLVHNQAREFAAVTAIAVDVRVTGTERPLPPVTVTEVYRMLQEGLANVYRHGQAGAVEIGLTYDTDGLVLTVRDNGRGFDPAAPRVRGRGLANMRERAARLGGALAVESAPGRGTCLTAVIPYQEGGHGADSGAGG
jgi:signal transduction histidine kinase